MPAYAALLLVVACLISAVSGHGVMTDPRSRGVLKTRRNINPRVLDPAAPLDYCFSCQNAGGVNVVRAHSHGHPWSSYKPLEGGRAGFGMCGDPVGNHDHMRAGRYANPKSMPYVRKYKPGSVANFEYDCTANHGGYLEFYLCDVSKMPYRDISFSGFKKYCHYLERVPHGSCESGNDPECGPIDPKFRGRWVLPCGRAGGDTGDQIMGGKNGKMAYKIPNVHIEDGVIHSYWLTTNACNTPDGFMQNYKYPRAWGRCFGDGGSIGGKPQHHLVCGKHNQFPEEFWNCADVQVKNGGKDIEVGGSNGYSPSNGHVPPKQPAAKGNKPESTPGGQANAPKSIAPKSDGGGHPQGRGGHPHSGGGYYYGGGGYSPARRSSVCTPHRNWCNGNLPCCNHGDVCLVTAHGNKCLKPDHNNKHKYRHTQPGNCYWNGSWCNISKKCCNEGDVCMVTKHGRKCDRPKLGSGSHGNRQGPAPQPAKKPVVEDGNCTRRGNWCSSSRRCCHESDVCQRTRHGSKCRPGKSEGYASNGGDDGHLAFRPK